jgi:hypothetical protein
MSREEGYSREEFSRRRLAAKRAIRRDSVIAASTSVVLGLISLGFLNWMDTFLAGALRMALSIGTFILFAGIVGWLLVKMKRTAKRVAVRCPQCNEALQDDAERIASATGKCEYCGGIVIEL